MVRFLSSAWVDAFDRAVSTAPTLVTESGEDLVIQHVVTDLPDGGEGTYHLLVSDGSARAASGKHPEPTVTFTQTYPTAAAIASGASSAQVAFMAGELRIGGRVDRLIANQAIFAGVEDVFAELRAGTEY